MNKLLGFIFIEKKIINNIYLVFVRFFFSLLISFGLFMWKVSDISEHLSMIYFWWFQECDFRKSKANSYLRVVYMGNIRISGCVNCCSRWYFTFNSAECQNPAPIDGALYHGPTYRDLNVHRPTNIEGYCGGIPAGNVRVGFSVGRCGGNLNTANAFTSWNQASRIIIEEVEPPVA